MSHTALNYETPQRHNHNDSSTMVGDGGGAAVVGGVVHICMPLLGLLRLLALRLLGHGGAMGISGQPPLR